MIAVISAWNTGQPVSNTRFCPRPIISPSLTITAPNGPPQPFSTDSVASRVASSMNLRSIAIILALVAPYGRGPSHEIATASKYRSPRAVARGRAVLFGAARSKERKSKADTEPQLRLVPLGIDEIERARASGHRAPDLNAPRRRHEIALAEGRIKGRADIKRLPGEAVEREPLVVPKIARSTPAPGLDLQC